MKKNNSNNSNKINNSKIWGGRFSSSSNQLMEEFNSSIQFDQKLYIEDIDGSIVHAEMLSNQKIILIQMYDFLRKISCNEKRIQAYLLKSVNLEN